ncbi:MAG: hypothetical protein E7Z87_07705 [Cyanobacteria bacterium SIG26]|nr:hypothetical protein [Cyanobacteria bacterium SIG26]
MKVEAINNRQNVVWTLAQGATIGAAAGLAGKYVLPLTPEEKKCDEYVKVMGKIHSQKNAYNFRTEKYLETLKSKENLSLAEDRFVKLFDGLKEGEHVKLGSIRKAIVDLTKIDKLAAADFRGLCRESSKAVKDTTKQCISAYNLVTKHIRPTGFFVTTGAVVGAFITLINDVLKTEAKH